MSELNPLPQEEPLNAFERSNDKEENILTGERIKRALEHIGYKSPERDLIEMFQDAEGNWITRDKLSLELDINRVVPIASISFELNDLGDWLLICLDDEEIRRINVQYIREIRWEKSNVSSNPKQ